MRTLILTGGIRHDFADNTDAVTALFSSVGIESEAWEDIDAGVARLAAEHFDLVTVMALRWPMEGNPRYASSRDDWGYHLPPETAQKLQDFVAGGSGLFGLHTASLCFDDWDGWRDLLGGKWRWGRSFHPPLGRITARPTNLRHPITQDIGGFTMNDEVFSDLDIAEDVALLLEARAETSAGAQPVLWTKAFGAGRVVYDAFGHDRGSLQHSVHRRIVQRCALWAGGAPEELITGI